MFNIDHIYDVLYTNLLQKNNIQGLVLKKFGECNSHKDVIPYPETPLFTHEDVYFYDQEPISFSTTTAQAMYDVIRDLQIDRWDLKYNVWATSERNNPLLDAFCERNNLVKWYYFYHAFASLDWFRTIQYLPKVNIYDGASYITLNNLCGNSRVYRPLFVSKLLSLGLLGDGIVTYNTDGYENNKFISPHDKASIKKLRDVGDKFRIQKTDYYKDNASAELEYDLWTSAFLHVVTETCYYEKTNHLTEKVFKPIVARQPFVMLGPAGSLAYLRSYGFETFDGIINESYDNEYDPAKRMDMVVDEIRTICGLTTTDKKAMYNDLMPILEHNFNHFYNSLFDVCWKELIANFDTCLSFLNANQEPTTRNPKLTSLDMEISSLKSLPGKIGDMFRDKFKQSKD